MKGKAMTNQKIDNTFEARTAIGSALRTKGDRYGHAGIAVLAHELVLVLSGDRFEAGAAKRISEATGYDKGTVSRVGAFLKSSKAHRTAATKLDVLAVGKATEGSDLFAAAVATGEMFKRVSTKGKGKGDGPDVLAILDKWLRDESINDTGRAARVAQVEAVLARLNEEPAQVADAA